MTRMLKATAMVALVAPLWMTAAGCGGGGGGGSGSTSSSSTTVSGAVIDGPVSGGTVTVKDSMVDGSMEGKKSGAALSAEMPTGFTSDTMVSVVTQQKALVGAEMVNNSLKVTQANETQISSDDAKTRFSRAMNKMDPSSAQPTH
ncbi:MAG: hypothetical protein HQL84_09330 [Magnetococcales bacterium]|nr:hypothetical protein [Magnetococcales bacterium]MBF0150233.1 hypothetical protein [Magnetococcales bacterium]MBF0630016.1 hypothetical protein [Magnetococcales bacterium]